MIESTLTRLLQNSNIFQRHSSTNNQPNTLSNPPDMSHPNLKPNNDCIHNHRYHNPTPIQGNEAFSNFQPVNLSPNTHFSSSSHPMNPEKITTIINNWHLKFDGSPDGLTIKEFLYRIKTLTRDTFNNDFTVICSNLNTMLTGKARDWYWRYHKQVQSITWESLRKPFVSNTKHLSHSLT